MSSLKPIYLFATSTHPKTINIKSLELTLLHPTIDFRSYDYLILTSKQTIKALLNYNKNDFIHLNAICVSQKTAKLYQDVGGVVVGVGDGYGDSLLNLITQLPKDKKWLYLRGESIASDFAMQARDGGFLVDEQILYTSGCSQEILDVRVEKDATLIFTSPSAVSCFLKNNSLTPTNSIVVIGTTTAKALPDGVVYTVSDATAIESCVDLALKV